MSIRIYNEGLSGASAPETSRTQEISRGGAGNRANQGSGAGGEDQVQISSLSETLSNHAAQRTAHVQNLKALYESGRYQVNAADVSHAIVGAAIQGGTAGSKH